MGNCSSQAAVDEMLNCRPLQADQCWRTESQVRPSTLSVANDADRREILIGNVATGSHDQIVDPQRLGVRQQARTEVGSQQKLIKLHRREVSGT